jgi:hypothetical protein
MGVFDVDSLVDRMDEDTIYKQVYKFFDSHIVPHLEEIRSRHDTKVSDKSRDEIREDLESLPPQERGEVFHDTMGELLVNLSLARLKPIESGTEVKKMVRDPYTVEALLLMFDREAVYSTRSEDEFPRVQKDTMAGYMKWMGVALAPEMYSREEVEEFVGSFDDVPSGMIDKWDEAHSHAGDDITEVVDSEIDASEQPGD